MAERKGRPRPGEPVSSLLPDRPTQPGDVEDVAGRGFRVTIDRGRFVDSSLAPCVTATIHPSAILRAPDEASRRDAMQGFVADLRSVAARLAEAETEQP